LNKEISFTTLGDVIHWSHWLPRGTDTHFAAWPIASA